MCGDFALGNAKSMMKGSLKYPVKILVMDDDEVRSERMVLGLRTAGDEISKLVVEDEDYTYEVVFAQCPNMFAPKRVDARGGQRRAGGGYECGDKKVYETIELKVRKNDPASRIIAWQPPPDAACWTSSVAEPAASAAPDDSAAAVAAAPNDSAATDSSAAPSSSAPSSSAPAGSAAPTTAASASPSAAPTPPPEMP